MRTGVKREVGNISGHGSVRATICEMGVEMG